MTDISFKSDLMREAALGHLRQKVTGMDPRDHLEDVKTQSPPPLKERQLGEAPKSSPIQDAKALKDLSIFGDPGAKIMVQQTRDSATGEVLEQTPAKDVVDRYARAHAAYHLREAEKIMQKEQVHKERETQTQTKNAPPMGLRQGRLNPKERV